MKTYLASTDPRTSVHGYIDYSYATEEQIQLTLNKVREDFPNAVVIDGIDDWHKPLQDRPETWPKKFYIPILAYFHSGISGLSKSGIIIDRNEFIALKQKYEDLFGIKLEENTNIKIYE